MHQYGNVLISFSLSDMVESIRLITFWWQYYSFTNHDIIYDFLLRMNHYKRNECLSMGKTVWQGFLADTTNPNETLMVTLFFAVFLGASKYISPFFCTLYITRLFWTLYISSTKRQMCDVNIVRSNAKYFALQTVYFLKWRNEQFDGRESCT